MLESQIIASLSGGVRGDLGHGHRARSSCMNASCEVSGQMLTCNHVLEIMHSRLRIVERLNLEKNMPFSLLQFPNSSAKFISSAS